MHVPHCCDMTPSTVRDACLKLVAYLESGEAPAGLFSDDVCLDFTPPLWRIQAQGLADVLAVRRRRHPQAGSVPRWRALTTAEGFVMELEERWVDDRSEWYCREVILAAMSAGRITRLTVYCTGDWDASRQQQHAREVVLPLPDLPATGPSLRPRVPTERPHSSEGGPRSAQPPIHPRAVAPPSSLQPQPP